LNTSKLTVALAQCNFLLGDLKGNAQKILNQATLASAAGAHILVTPELSLTGYPPEDLLLREAFLTDVDTQLDLLRQALTQFKDLFVVIGHPQRHQIQHEVKLFNQATVFCNGQLIASYSKQRLPNSEVFDEVRYFTPGNQACVFTVAGVQLGLIICEDAWHSGPAMQAKQAGAELLIIPNASPFHMKKTNLRYEVIKAQAIQTQMPAIYVNMVGGQDELVFDGASFALNAQGEIVDVAPQFVEYLSLITYANHQLGKGTITPESSIEKQVYDALVLGVKDYIGKNGFPGAILGLSGGVDSALVLAIAVDAIGADRVRAVMMPSRYTADISWIDAKDMAERLHVQYDEIPIAAMFDAFESSLAKDFAGLPFDATEENIQARVRGTLLMALSNKSGRIVLTTGNKSEMAVGYCTLYGDMAGGFAVIKDVVKTLVYRLCHYRNTISPVIPERIITRPPSAELRPDQKDQDSLPPYEILDAILENYMENDVPIEKLLESGFSQEDVEKVTRLIKINEYKRRQSPIGVRITHRAFGRDWRYPITSKYRG
jgi:NAD+ synthase (glutamine-hydrolysing)